MICRVNNNFRKYYSILPRDPPNARLPPSPAQRPPKPTPNTAPIQHAAKDLEDGRENG